MKQIIVSVNPAFKAEDGTQFDAVVSALDFFEIPANLVEVDSDHCNSKIEALLESLKACLGVVDWAIDNGGNKAGLNSIKKMATQAITRCED